jgi:thiosulfate reductase cytochrome b subunit
VTQSANAANIVNRGITRSIIRWIHLVLAIPILGYIYSPFEQIPNYAPATRFIFVPILLLSGLWMWKGHVVRRLISKRSALQDAGAAEQLRHRRYQ